MVASYMGAWIEIPSKQRHQVVLSTHPIWVRALK